MWFINFGILWNNSGSSAFFFLLLCLIGLSVVDGLFDAAGGGFLPADFFLCGSSAFASFFFVFVVFGAFDADVDAVNALAFNDDVDASAAAFIASASTASWALVLCILPFFFPPMPGILLLLLLLTKCECNGVDRISTKQWVNLLEDLLGDLLVIL